MTPSYVKFIGIFIFRSELCALHIWQTHNNENKVIFKIINNYRGFRNFRGVEIFSGGVEIFSVGVEIFSGGIEIFSGGVGKFQEG